MEGEKIRILLIEDNPGDARLLRELLAAKDGASFDLEHEDRLSTALARLAQDDIDVILLDLSLPDSHGLDGLNKICAQAPKVPIVVLSGLSDEAVAIKAVQEGAQDYLVKGSVDSDSLVRSLHYAIERQHLRVALRESEARYRLLADNAADVIWTANMKWQITYISPSIKRLLGYTVEEMKRLALGDILTPDSLEQAGKLIRNQMDIMTPRSQYPSLSLTLEHLRKDGSTLWAEVMLSFLWDKDGKLFGIMGATRDITERKKAEEALRESEHKFRRFVEEMNDGYFIIQDFKIVFVNSRSAEMFGYSVSEVLGKSLEELLPYEVRKELLEWHTKRLRGEAVPQQYEVMLPKKDGTVCTVEFGIKLIDYAGRPAVSVLMRDITERKRMEEALRESEKHYSALVGSLTDAVFKIKGRVITWCNDKVDEIYGYTKDELIGKKPIFLLPVAVNPLEFIGGVITTIEERGSFHSSGRVKRKDGSMVDIEYSISQIPGRESAELVAVARDITERKRMEEELRLLSDAVRMTTDSVAITDMGGRILDINEAGLRMYGLGDRADFVGKNPLDAIAPEDRRKAIENMAKLVETGHVEGIEYHVLRKDGSRILIETSVSVIRGGNGEPKGLVAVARNITERKKAEEALKQSEKRYRQLFESMQEGLWLIDKDSITTFVNPRMAEILGYTAEEMLGKHLFAFMDERGIEVAKYNLERRRQGIKEQHDFEFIRKDGARVYASLETSPITDEAGNYVGALACVADITERKKADEALKLSEERYRLLVDNASEAIVVIQDGMFKFFNDRAVELLGYSREELASKPFIELIHPDDQQMLMERYLERLKGGNPPSLYSFKVINKAGNVLWGEVNAVAITWEGRPATLNFLTDVTERKKAEEEKQRMEEQLRLAGRLAAVGELSAGVAHELNNPIAAIQGFAQLLTGRNDLDETTKKDLGIIYREAQRAAKITQNLLSFARRHEPEKGFVSLNEVLEKTIELRAHQMKVNNIEVVVEFATDLPKTTADFFQMQQVFVNIINNAEQAMVEAHRKGRLVVKTQKAGNMIQATFADDGPGISEDNLKRIFDPFFTTKEVGKGTGLGLSICYGIVEAHGGRIYARSKLGQGATVVVEIPIVAEGQ